MVNQLPNIPILIILDIIFLVFKYNLVKKNPYDYFSIKIEHFSIIYLYTDLFI